MNMDKEKRKLQNDRQTCVAKGNEKTYFYFNEKLSINTFEKYLSCGKA